MKKQLIHVLCLVLAATFYSSIISAADADIVVEDHGVKLTRQELEYLVKFWTPDMRAAAANDDGDRLELINMALANKKIAEKAKDITPETDADAYWRHVFEIRNKDREFVVRQYIKSLDVPDMTQLAQERYKTDKDKYALVPEERLSSHILLMCLPGKCDRAKRRPEAQKILDELKAGADFENLVALYSEDPGSKDKGGRFDRWLTLGMAGVAPRFTGGVFSIEKPGGYSDIVETQFGFHIIRLDDVHPAHYKPFADVKDRIIADLRGEYIKLAAQDFDASFRISDDAKINGTALEEILAPYKSAD